MVCAFDVHAGVSRLREVPLLLIGSAHSASPVTNAEAAATASGRAQECCMLAVATTEFVTVSQISAVLSDPVTGDAVFSNPVRRVTKPRLK